MMNSPSRGGDEPGAVVRHLRYERRASGTVFTGGDRDVSVRARSSVLLLRLPSAEICWLALRNSSVDGFFSKDDESAIGGEPAPPPPIALGDEMVEDEISARSVTPFEGLGENAANEVVASCGVDADPRKGVDDLVSSTGIYLV
jgi:hypothetical protein